MKFLLALILAALSTLSLTAKSDERFRPKSPHQLPVNSTSDPIYHVPHARVAYANYALIRKDFHQTANMSDSEIDAWIIKNFAYISAEQLKMRGLWTSDFEVDLNNSKLAYRPPNYIRSGMVEAEEGGMADLKGLGYPPGTKLNEVLRVTGNLREKLKAAKASYEKALATHTGIEEAKSNLDYAEAVLSHKGASMRFGEANAETYKQETLQNVGNRLNQISNEQKLNQPRIETVETYFEIHLPWKAKDALGESEESVALYGRQPTFGHGRGSDISSKIAFNPIPHVGTEPAAKYQGSNALQISNSGAIFDFGSQVTTVPEAIALHGYRQYTAEAVARGAYFDLYDSNINQSAYALARDMDQKPNTWEEKRNWFMEQRAHFVPYLDVPAAPLTGTYARLVYLYNRAESGAFNATDASEVLKYIHDNNEKSLGSNSLKDTVQQRSDRIEYLRLQAILSALDKKEATLLIQQANEESGNLKLASLLDFFDRLESVVTIHTEGMGDVPVPPTYGLWDAMRSSGNKTVSTYALEEQIDNLEFSLNTGKGNPILESSLAADLQNDDYTIRRLAMKALFDRTGNIKPFAKKLVTHEDIQNALIVNFQKNDAYQKQASGPDAILERTEQQKLRALKLLEGTDAHANCIRDSIFTLIPRNIRSPY